MAEPGSDLLLVTADGDSDHESELSRLEVRRSSQHELTSIGREEVESEKGTGESCLKITTIILTQHR
jgi:hypothetical protein